MEVEKNSNTDAPEGGESQVHSVHVPGKGSFQWNRAPMGLLGSLPSFVRMMEFLMTNLQDITYQEDLLIHTRTQKEQL